MLKKKQHQYIQFLFTLFGSQGTVDCRTASNKLTLIL